MPQQYNKKYFKKLLTDCFCFVIMNTTKRKQSFFYLCYGGINNGRNRKKLKDYKGFEVWKITDNKGTNKEEITYMLNDSDGNNINCFVTLKELKQFADSYN